MVIDSNTEYYLVSMLRQVSPETVDVALVELREEALRLRKVELFKKLGDIALLKSSIFREAAKVDVKYMEAVGSQAYLSASTLAFNNSKASIFYDLGDKFCKYSELLGSVSEELTLSKDPVELYLKYKKSGSDILLNKISKLGIFLNLAENEA